MTVERWLLLFLLVGFPCSFPRYCVVSDDADQYASDIASCFLALEAAEGILLSVFRALLSWLRLMGCVTPGKCGRSSLLSGVASRRMFPLTTSLHPKLDGSAFNACQQLFLARVLKVHGAGAPIFRNEIPIRGFKDLKYTESTVATRTVVLKSLCLVVTQNIPSDRVYCVALSISSTGKLQFFPKSQAARSGKARCEIHSRRLVGLQIFALC